MFVVSCPGTRNQEFGQLLSCLTEKYCEMVNRMDLLLEELQGLKDKNDKVIQFQEEHFGDQGASILGLVRLLEEVRSTQEKEREKTATELRETRELLEERVEKLQETENRAKQDMHQEFRSRCEASERRLNAIEKHNKKEEEKLESLQQTFSEHKLFAENKLATLDGQMSDVEKEQKITKEISGQMEGLIRDKAQSETEIKDLIAANIDTVNKQLDMKVEVARFTELEQDLHSTRERLTSQLETNKQETDTHLNRMQEGQEALKESVEKIKASTDQCLLDIGKNHEEFKDFASNLERKTDGQTEGSKAEIEERKSENSQLRGDISELRMRLQTLQTDLKTTNSKMESENSAMMENVTTKGKETAKAINDLNTDLKQRIDDSGQSLRRELKLVKDNLNTKIDDNIQLAVEDARSQIKLLEEKVSNVART